MVHRPTEYAAGYTLDLYCRNLGRSFEYDDHKETFFGRTFTGCAREARAAGWTIHKDRTATCPKCNRRKKDD